MPSSLPLLHTAMPTPCLNPFCHSDRYIFLHFLEMFFLSGLCYFWGSLIFSEDRQFHAAAANGELWWIQLASAACGVSNHRNRLPMDKSDRLASFPGGKPENEATCHGSATWLIAHAHNNFKWRPTPGQVLKCLVFRLIRTDEVRKILWYRGPSRWEMQPFRAKSTVST